MRLTDSVSFALMCLVAWVWWPVPAQATTYSTVFCFDYDVDFVDAASGDYWPGNSDKVARGIRAKVIRNSDGVTMWFDFADAETGCTPAMNLDSAEQYTVRVRTDAEVSNSNVVEVRNNSTDRLIFAQDVDTTFSPAASETIDYVFTNWTGIYEDVTNAAGAAGYAVNKRYGGTSSETYTLFNEQCSGGGSCTDSNLEVYLSTAGKSRKYIIVHEVGHALGSVLDEYDLPYLDYGASSTSCDEYTSTSHDLVSKEYQSAGAAEGFAHFYAATVWNDWAEYDCDFYYYKTIDFNKDSIGDAPQVYSCEAGADYLATNCDTPFTDRSTEYDWLRFWWDFHTEHDVSFGVIANIWDGADPRLWTNSSAFDDLRDSADAEGYLTEWDLEDGYNGVDQ